MQSFFNNNDYSFRPIKNDYNTITKHIPFVPVFIEEDITKLTQNEKEIYMMKKKRRNIYRMSVNSWLDSPLIDMDGVVFELPKNKNEFLDNILEKYKIKYLTKHNKILGIEDLSKNYFDNKENINEYEKKHNIEFIIKEKNDVNNTSHYVDNKDKNKIFVSENELINTLQDSDIEEYNVNVRDVLRTIYKEILELIFYNDFDIIDMNVFKEDFIHFMYILSDIDTIKLLKKYI